MFGLQNVSTSFLRAHEYCSEWPLYLWGLLATETPDQSGQTAKPDISGIFF